MQFEPRRITRLFRPVASDKRSAAKKDEHGFIVRADDTLTVEELLEMPVVLITAPPWTGKTFVSERLKVWLDWSDDATSDKKGSFSFSWRTDLVDYNPSNEIVPPEWEEWRESSSTACWIIDSLDEGERLETNLYTRILELISGLGPTERDRLCLLLFCRKHDVPPNLTSNFKSKFTDRFNEVDLLLLDADNARELVGEVQWENTLALIQRCELDSVSRYPAALEVIKDLKPQADVNETDVWEKVLKKLLDEPNLIKRKRFKSTLTARFETACHLAVVLTFSSDLQKFRSPSNPDSTDVDEVLQNSGTNAYAAAKEAFETSMFKDRGGYEFAEKNIREWMCAFGLREFRVCQLRPLLTTPGHELSQSYTFITGLLERISKHRAVKDWIIQMGGGFTPFTDLGERSLGEVKGILDRIEGIAKNSDWNLHLFGNEGLEQMDVSGVGQELAKRISDRSRTIPEREAMFDVADAIGVREVVPIAATIVLDAEENIHLRISAAYFIGKAGGDKELLEMTSFIETFVPKTPEEKRIPSAMMWEILDRGLWTVAKAAKHAPQWDGRIGDATSHLETTIGERMTLRDAREIFLSLEAPTGRGTGRSKRSRRNGSPYLKAVEMLLKEDPPDGQILLKLIPIIIRKKERSWVADFRHEISWAYAKSRESRRQLYLADFRCSQRFQGRAGNWWIILAAEDLDWLVEQAKELNHQDIWKDLLRLATSNAPSRKSKIAIRKVVREREPELVKDFDRRRRKLRESERKWKKKEEKRDAEEEASQISLETLIREYFRNTRLSALERMWNLASVCFVNEHSRPINVIGEWQDLPAETREKVLDASQNALENCEPSIIPDGDKITFPTYMESCTFRKVLSERPDHYDLSRDQIRKWLPAVLRSSDGDRDEVVELCSKTDREATEDALLESTQRDLRSGYTHISALSYLPAKYWTERLVSKVAFFIRNVTYPDQSRAELLRILGPHRREEVVPICEEILKGERPGLKKPSALNLAALDVLLALDGDKAWPVVKKRYLKRKKETLMELPSLHDRHHNIRIKLSEWPPSRLLELAKMLYECIPEEEDPDYSKGAHWVTPEDHLRDLRRNLRSHLFDRSGKDDDANLALEKLADEIPSVRDWLTYVRAQENVENILVQFENPGHLPYHRIRRLLENPDYRIVRSDNDLLDILVDELEEIGKDAADDLPMLYLPEEGKSGEKRRHEEAIQVYIRTRLRDRLPRLGLTREVVVKFRRRPDITITAPTIAGDTATVVIEVKWSDNKDVSTGLNEQLGKKYLKDENKKHGIYLVGWNGICAPWKKASLGEHPSKKCMDLSDLRQRLEEIARVYVSKESSLTIRPIMLDLEW